MNNSPLKRKPLARWVAFALAATTVAGVVQAAAPLAGTEIKNLATVSYEDENGNKYTAQSNEAVITVKEQYRATLENDKSLTAAPGQTVYFSHTLVNEGNVADTYALTTDIAIGVKIYKDTNGNGQPDAGEPEITSMTLAAGETGHIVVSYAVPQTAVEGDVTTVVLTAQSSSTDGIVEDAGDNFDAEATGESAPDANGNITPLGDDSATNHDKVTVTNGPVLVLNKESVVDTTAKTITYTLTVRNIGSSDATAVDDIMLSNELHLPVDRDAVIYLTSKDVIHSFSLPMLRVKQDAIPGMEIPVSFRPTKTGYSEIACAQLCGNSHYRMKGFLYIHTLDSYESFIKASSTLAILDDYDYGFEAEKKLKAVKEAIKSGDSISAEKLAAEAYELAVLALEEKGSGADDDEWDDW